MANDFDPEFAALMDEMKAKVGALEWTGGMMARRTGGPSFRALVEVCERQAARANQIFGASGLIDLDPDHAGEAVRTRMHHSLFSQGWLPMLETDDAAWMIDRLGLRGEYSKLEEPVDIERRNCGGCGQTVTALPGSKSDRMRPLRQDARCSRRPDALRQVRRPADVPGRDPRTAVPVLPGPNREGGLDLVPRR